MYDSPYGTYILCLQSNPLNPQEKFRQSHQRRMTINHYTDVQRVMLGAHSSGLPCA